MDIRIGLWIIVGLVSFFMLQREIAPDSLGEVVFLLVTFVLLAPMAAIFTLWVCHETVFKILQKKLF